MLMDATFCVLDAFLPSILTKKIACMLYLSALNICWKIKGEALITQVSLYLCGNDSIPDGN
jgi:hypothetical protein